MTKLKIIKYFFKYILILGIWCTKSKYNLICPTTLQFWKKWQQKSQKWWF